MEQEQEQGQEQENVGSSLINALFEAVDGEEPTQGEQEESPEQEGEMNIYGLSDAVEMAVQAPEESAPPVTEEPKAVVPEKLNTVDKALFETGDIPEPKEESRPEEPVQEVVQKEEEDLGWLTEDQKRRLDLVEFADDNFDEYKGKRKEHIEFFKAQKDYIEARISEDPNAALDESDYDYQNFLNRKKPKFNQDDLERVVEKRTRTLAKQEAMQELKPELDKLRSEQKRQEIKPRVEELKNKTMSDIKNLIPEQMRNTINNSGVEAAYEENPVQYEIVNRIITAHQSAMFAFHEIANGYSKFDQTNPDHARLARWVDQLEATMPEKQGKKFVNINQFNQLPVVEQKKVYTLTAEEVVDYANKKAGEHINHEVNSFEEKLRKSGYTKTGQSVASHSHTPSPKPVRSAPREGHVLSSPRQSTEEKNPVLSALGL